MTCAPFCQAVLMWRNCRTFGRKSIWPSGIFGEVTITNGALALSGLACDWPQKLRIVPHALEPDAWDDLGKLAQEFPRSPGYRLRNKEVPDDRTDATADSCFRTNAPRLGRSGLGD